MNLLFEDFTDKYLKKSFFWLSDPTLNRLTNTPHITAESQLSWFKSLPLKKDYFIKSINFEGNPIGACGLKHINGRDAELWCYIGEKSAHGKGIGHCIIDYLIHYALELGLSSIYLNVIPSNIIARHLYEAHGFIETKRDEEYIHMSLLLNKRNNHDKISGPGEGHCRPRQGNQ